MYVQEVSRQRDSANESSRVELHFPATFFPSESLEHCTAVDCDRTIEEIILREEQP